MCKSHYSVQTCLPKWHPSLTLVLSCLCWGRHAVACTCCFIFSADMEDMNFSSIYASPTSGEAYRNRQLTTNFELWVEIFCVPTCFHVRIPKPCLSVCPSVCLSVCLSICPHPEKRYHHSFVNISPTLVIDTSMQRSSRVLHHGNPKIKFFFQTSSKFGICLLTKSWNHLSFVNISPTLVIDTSMERSSRVLHHGNLKIWIFFQKSSKLNLTRILTCAEELKSFK